MERTLRDNEKMRKAEEIYYRRNFGNDIKIPNSDFCKKNKSYVGSKVLLELLILIITIIAVFAIKNKNFIFTENFLNMIGMYNVNITEKVKSLFAEEEYNEKNITNTFQEEYTENTNIESNIDAEAMEGFIKPVDGIITSKFGNRESNYKNVTSNHTGIDISNELNTIIISSISGIVEQVSNQGDYGNHIKITKNNISTLYAHCEQILVNEGQEVIQGQEIATIGNTGNSTGPHLHFEIRVDNTPVDPMSLISF